MNQPNCASACVAPSVTVTRTNHSPGSRLPVHTSPASYLSILLRGSYHEQIGSTTLHCRPMEMRFHPSGEEHAHVIGPLGARCTEVALGDAWRESVDALASGTTAPLLVRAPGWWPVVVTDGPASDDADGVLESWTAALLALCERQARVQRAAERSEGVRRAIASIDDRLDQRLTLTGLAREAGLHPTHFARSFRALTGYSVGEYIRRRRIARAQQLFVSQPSLTVSRVAAESGFFDHAHLTRTFRRALGVPPNGYRSVLRQKGILA